MFVVSRVTTTTQSTTTRSYFKGDFGKKFLMCMQSEQLFSDGQSFLTRFTFSVIEVQIQIRG